MKSNKKIETPETIEATETSEHSGDFSSSASSFESDIQHSFFYTNDKFFDNLDTKDIMNNILKKYPLLDQSQTDAVIKKQLIFFLNDTDFIEHILKFYNLSVYDMFKILYSQYGSLFKGPFLKKVKNQLDGKHYATIVRKKKY